MGSEAYPLRNIGIYHNLPTFDPSIKGLTAMITGANGISGFATLRALLDSPDRWSKIYAISRRPPPKEMMELLTADQRSRVEHIASDFLKTPEEIAEAIKKSGLKKVDCKC
jgi:NAD(P)-dependent dehydrogenase (short-subunit alcohol dehydrogenase family)